MKRSSGQVPELRDFVGRLRGSFLGIAGLSTVLNILALSGSIFMMLSYDMVLPSRSAPTLLGLLLMVTVAYLFQGAIEILRSRALIQIGATLDRDFAAQVHQAIEARARTKASGDGVQVVRDLDLVTSFVGGPGPSALIDLPWMLFFIIVLFIMHPAMGVTVLIGAIMLILLTLYTDRASRAPSERLTTVGTERFLLASTTQRHAEVLRALGMLGRFEQRWTDVSRRYQQTQQSLTKTGSTLSGASRVLRVLLQSVVLAVGCLLVIEGKASAGIIFAGSLLSGRALAPVDMAIANWRNFVAARQAWSRLGDALAGAAKDQQHQQLPTPRVSLSVERVSVAPPGTERLTVMDVSFRLKAGQAVGILGPSGSGKSSLVRAITGAWPTVAGKIRLDGAAIDQWSPDELGCHIGYLPQTVELIRGTVAENISRFEEHARSEEIISAAQLAGVNELILRLPQGYETQVGSDGSSLSAGQRQRIALARALYRKPFLIVLDEPNSNLDTAGEVALAEAVTSICDSGSLVVLVAHRPSILSAVDTILYMADGRLRAFGPKQEVLDALEKHSPRPTNAIPAP